MASILRESEVLRLIIMKVLVAILVALVAGVESSLRPTYSLPHPPPPGPGPSPPHGGGYGTNNGHTCGHGQVLHGGRCVTPEVSRHIYVYNVPPIPKPPGHTPHVPDPKVEHNIIFVRLPEGQGQEDPIVVPPPQQKNIVYVLNKKTDGNGSGVIHVPAPPKSNPEVYFVNYGNGENPVLPTGEDLQSALAKSKGEHKVEVVGGGGGGGSSPHYGNNNGIFIDPPHLYTTP